MTVSKASEFEATSVELAAFFKALAHPARVDIMKVLSQRGACVCGEIVHELPLAQATVSQHLKALKEAGLIAGEIEGPAVCYCIDYDVLHRLLRAAESYFSQIQTTCC